MPPESMRTSAHAQACSECSHASSLFPAPASSAPSSSSSSSPSSSSHIVSGARRSSTNSSFRCLCSSRRPRTLPAERRSRSPIHAGRACPGKLRASSPSSTLHTPRTTHTPRRPRSSGGPRTHCSSSENGACSAPTGSRSMLRWSAVIALFLLSVPALPRAQAGVVPSLARHGAGHAHPPSVILPAAETSARASIPGWRRQGSDSSGSAAAGGVVGGDRGSDGPSTAAGASGSTALGSPSSASSPAGSATAPTRAPPTSSTAPPGRASASSTRAPSSESTHSQSSPAPISGTPSQPTSVSSISVSLPIPLPTSISLPTSFSIPTSFPLPSFSLSFPLSFPPSFSFSLPSFSLPVTLSLPFTTITVASLPTLPTSPPQTTTTSAPPRSTSTQPSSRSSTVPRSSGTNVSSSSAPRTSVSATGTSASAPRSSSRQSRTSSTGSRSFTQRTTSARRTSTLTSSSRASPTSRSRTSSSSVRSTSRTTSRSSSASSTSTTSVATSSSASRATSVSSTTSSSFVSSKSGTNSRMSSRTSTTTRGTSSRRTTTRGTTSTASRSSFSSVPAITSIRLTSRSISIPVTSASGTSSNDLSSTSASSSTLSSSSTTLTSSRPVLGPTSARSTTTVRGRTTLYTTVVETTTYLTGGKTRTSTLTTVVPTGTLIPNQATTGNDIFSHNKGALAGLIIGIIAFVALISAWGVFAYRRHRVHHMQAEAAAAALGRSNGGNRALTLDGEDDDDGHAATRFVGAGPVSHPPSQYDRLRGGRNLESPAGDDGGVGPVGDARSQDDAGGGMVGLAPVPIVGGGEDASLMHPANRSAADVSLPTGADVVTGLGILPPLRPPKSPARSLSSRPSSGPGPEPAAWLGGRAVSYGSLRSPAPIDIIKTDMAQPASPTSPVSRSSVYSDEVLSSVGHTTINPDAQLATLAASALGTSAYASRNASLSSHGHGGHAGSSAHEHSGGGSSSGGHGSSSGHKSGTGSSSSHMRGSVGGSTHGHAPLIVPPGPSSLLPTQTHRPDAPPSSYRDYGDEESGRSPGSPRRMSGFLGRSLRGLRIRSPRQSVSSLSAVMGGSQANTSPSDSSTLLANPRQSVYDPSTLRPSSIYRPQSPILSSMPESAFSQAPGIYVSAAPPGGPTTSASLGPHAVTAHGAPIWPGLGPQSGQPSMPSPALTEVSSFATPEGLLNPSLALRLGAQGMQSQGALSFRDDMDYSRPIGGMVNNRQHSRTTLHTMSTESRRRPSLESRDTQGTHTTGTETVHPFAEAASPPTSGRASTEGSSVHS